MVLAAPLVVEWAVYLAVIMVAVVLLLLFYCFFSVVVVTVHHCLVAAVVVQAIVAVALAIVIEIVHAVADVAAKKFSVLEVVTDDISFIIALVDATAFFAEATAFCVFCEIAA